MIGKNKFYTATVQEVLYTEIFVHMLHMLLQQFKDMMDHILQTLHLAGIQNIVILDSMIIVMIVSQR